MLVREMIISKNFHYTHEIFMELERKKAAGDTK